MYYNIEGDDNVSMWILVDLVLFELMLEFVVGLYCGLWLMLCMFMDKEVKWFLEGSFVDLFDIEVDCVVFLICYWVFEFGDMVCFWMLMLYVLGGM